MPLVSTTPKKQIENQYNAIAKLQEKCGSCKSFRGKVAKSIFIYEICTDYKTEDGPAMLAIADFDDNNYAIYAPEYLTDKQLVVFEFLLRDVDDKDKIVVFSQRSYDAVKKYSYVKPVNVKLHV